MARLNNSIFEKLHVPPSLISFIKNNTSLAFRKRVKSILGLIFTPAKNHIPNIPKKTFSNTDYFVFSLINWDGRYQRPQHLSSSLAKLGNRVFYINHEFLSHPNIFSVFSPIQIIPVEKNLYQVNISALRELFIYQDSLNWINKKILLSSIKHLFYSVNTKNPVAIIDHPFWAQICNEIGIPYVYDCMDKHDGFVDNNKNNQSLENKLFNSAFTTVVTSHYLYNYASKYSDNVQIIPNAGDYNHFSQVPNYIPSDIKNIPHPIVGYYGAIAEWFDVNLLESVLTENPQKSFVLIGNVDNKSVLTLKNKFKNLYLLGEKSYSELPNYLHQFDVCIIPFILNELIIATHPVKIFEYLAAGKPVVSTRLPEIADNQLIEFADSKDFSIKINNSLKSTTQQIKSRQLFASKNTWDNRAKLLNSITQDYLYPKVSVIILSYNHPDLLKKTLDSVVNQSFYPNLEVVLVDNNSNHETIDFIKTYPRSNKLKIILNQENYGFAKGNNIGLSQATGDYLILLNNDVVVTPGWITRLLFHVRKSNVGLVGPITNSIGNEAKVDLSYDINDQKKFYDQVNQYCYQHWNQTMEVNTIAAFCWIMSREVFKKVGNLDEIYGRGMFEDDDYCLRVRKLGLKVLIADDVFIHHFGSASFKQISNPEYQRLFNDNKSKFEKKWGITWTPHKYRQ